MDSTFLAASIKMFGTLVLITCLIILLVFFLKRFRLKSFSIRGVSQLRLIGILNLSPKTAVAVVEVCGEWLVLGLASERVTLLTKLSPPAKGGDREDIFQGNRKKENKSSDVYPS